LILFALNLGLGFSYIGLWIVSISQGLFWRADFTAFYTAFSMVRDGYGNRLYDFDLQTAYQQQILGGKSFQDGLLPFINPPYVAVLFVPLAWLSHWSAFSVWMLAQVGVVLWLLRLLWNISSTWSYRERWLLLSVALAFPPLFSTLMLGTFSLLLLVVLLQLYLALKQNRSYQAGLWLIAGTIKPQVVVFPLILLLGNRNWRVIGITALVMALLFVLTAGLFGWHIWEEFLRTLQLANTFYDQFGIVPNTMYNLKGMLTLILGNQHGVLISRICNIAFLAAASLSLILWRRLPLHDDPQFELRFGLVLLLGLFFSPHLHSHDGVMLIAPALLFYIYLRQYQPEHTTYVMFILLCPFLFLIGEFAVGSSLGVRIPSLVMIALLAWIMYRLAMDRGTPARIAQNT
jgi:hypothetical protein